MGKEYWDILDETGAKTGRIHERGLPMQQGEYHLSVTIWIRNSRGEFLISQRAPTKNMPLMWEPTSGGVISGEDGLSAALREVREELGIELCPNRGYVWRRYPWLHSDGSGAALIELWIFDHEVELSELTLCPEETCAAKWVNAKQMREMISRGEMIPYTYMEDLLSDTL